MKLAKMCKLKVAVLTAMLWCSGCVAEATGESLSAEATAESEQAIALATQVAQTAVYAPTPNRADADLDSLAYVTSFSGDGPADRSLVKSYTFNQGLTGVSWGESTDDPCYLQAKYRQLTTDATGGTLTFDECDNKSVGNYKHVSLPADYFVTGVRVCQNSGGDKVKGVQLIGQHILCLLGAEGLWVTPDECTTIGGGLFSNEYQICSETEPRFVSCDDLELDRYQEHTNCQGDKDGPDADWESTVRCPGANQLATGMKFGITGGSGDRLMIEGIALECHALE